MRLVGAFGIGASRVEGLEDEVVDDVDLKVRQWG